MAVRNTVLDEGLAPGVSPRGPGWRDPSYLIFHFLRYLQSRLFHIYTHIYNYSDWISLHSILFGRHDTSTQLSVDVGMLTQVRHEHCTHHDHCHREIGTATYWDPLFLSNYNAVSLVCVISFSVAVTAFCFLLPIYKSFVDLWRIDSSNIIHSLLIDYRLIFDQKSKVSPLIWRWKLPIQKLIT